LTGAPSWGTMPAEDEMIPILLVAALAAQVPDDEDDAREFRRLVEARESARRPGVAWQSFLLAAARANAARAASARAEEEALRARWAAGRASAALSRSPSDPAARRAADRAARARAEACSRAAEAKAAKEAALRGLKAAEAELAAAGKPPGRARFRVIANGEEVLASQLAETSDAIILKRADDDRRVVARKDVVALVEAARDDAER